jgi:hypothetical protein
MRRRVPRVRQEDRTAHAGGRPTLRVDRDARYCAARTNLAVSIIVTDPSTLPAPGGRHPTPARGAVETCADPERNGGESEAVPEKETISEAEARSKAGATDEARTKACTTETTATKSTSKSASKSTSKSTASKAATEATAAEATGIAGIGSHYGTEERHCS